MKVQYRGNKSRSRLGSPSHSVSIVAKGLSTAAKINAVLTEKLCERGYEQPACPKCETPMLAKPGPKGIFCGCARYPSCRGTRKLEPNDP